MKTCWHRRAEWLVSTYVVCERLSVMHEPAGVVEILVQILQNTPILKYSFRIPPPPSKMKIVRDLGTLTFQFQNTPPPNENCQRSWHFDFSVSEYPPPPPQKWKLSEILALWLFSFRIPPENWNLVRSWHFKIFQFQNNWYQWQTMCGKLPHVETLSSPDNYSLTMSDVCCSKCSCSFRCHVW